MKRPLTPCCNAVRISTQRVLGDSDRGPEPGDFSICAVCSALLIVTEDDGRRLATDEEIQAEFDACPGLEDYINGLRDLFRARNLGAVIQ